ncbi:fumarylacetoacetate hydrolase family protein [Pseudoduganella plicata]|uniref:Fumarylacetoacetate (FAA) hydrolase n=1 Tax=Pseudoduganella plicata TaxID=321984 RepID=A0A4P7BD45_9BURK|nr:fumarylacetoacetate hydrolase family protein [Pseudoduganella plicata]QBQ36464.1 fumarylacetoacetate hydrolase [Pseudoduganella plicata]GGY75191.1 fumarylacetoacetate (FAA) hydrolase [Pseudoduganella plicata]
MKLATLNDGTRDGQLIVVARDLKSAVVADGIAASLQRALDDWAFIAPQLDTLSRQLNDGKARRTFEFDPRRCMAPLPRAYQWAECSAYLHHVELLRKAEGGEMPASFRRQPPTVQGASDDLLGPTDDIVVANEAWGIDFAAQLAAVTDDVPMGATPDDAYQRIRLLMLANGVSLRHLLQDELVRGCGAFRSRPATAFSPVAVTPDELGEAWQDAKVHLPLRASWNGRLVGQPHVGKDMTFNFAQLIAHAASTRRLRTGTILGTGPVSNKDAKKGYSCIAEKRILETIAEGKPVTAFMAFGDTVRIEMLDADGKSVFGAIDQTVRPTGYVPPAPEVAVEKTE